MYHRRVSSWLLVFALLFVSAAASAEDVPPAEPEAGEAEDPAAPAETTDGDETPEAEPEAPPSDDVGEADEDPDALPPADREKTDADRQAALEAYEKAVELYNEGKLVDSALKLEEAYGFDPNPVLAYNIGKAYDDAARFKQAKKWYRRALSGELAEDERRKAAKALERIEKTEDELAAQVEEMKPTDARLQVSSNMDSAVVYLDGKVVGETPFSKVVEPGSYTVRVEAEGREAHSELVELAAGDSLLVRAALAPPPRSSLMPWFWATTGLGIAGLGLGIPTDIVAKKNYDDALELRDQPGKLEDKKKSGKTMQTLAITGYSIAGAAFIAASVLLIIELTSDEPESGLQEMSDASWSIGVGATGASLRLSW